MKRWDRADFPTLTHFPNIHSFLRKITIDQYYIFETFMTLIYEKIFRQK